MVWLVTWNWWDRAILAVIAFNTILLAITDFSVEAINLDTLYPDSSHSPRNAFIAACEPYFTAIFTIEAVCKIIAMGFVTDRGSYLRDHWNKLDFLVVITSILQAVPSMPNVSALRAFRILRPLRTLSRLRGMRMMVTSLLSSIPQLLNVGTCRCQQRGRIAALHSRVRDWLVSLSDPFTHPASCPCRVPCRTPFAILVHSLGHNWYQHYVWIPPQQV